jgi:hypothetical protein
MENIHASAREWLWKNHGFNGTILGAVTMALFIKIAGRKKGISPHLTLQHDLIQHFHPTEHRMRQH